MALEIKIGIDVEGNAERKLASIEQGLQKVQSTAKSTADPISKVTSNIKDLATSESKLAAEVNHATKNVEFGTAAYFAQRRAIVDSQIASDKLAMSQGTLAGATTALAAATGLSTTALLGTTAAVAAVVASGAAWTALLGSAAKHYFLTSEATKDSRMELDKLSDSYETFQTIVGQSILGGSFSIAAPIHALNSALVVSGVLIAARIEETKFWIDMLTHGALTTVTPFGPPGIAQGTFSAQGLRMWQNAVPGSTEYAFQTTLPGQTSAAMAQQMFDAQQRENARAARAGRPPRRVTPNDLPGVSLGVPGNIGYQYPVGSPLFDWNGLSPTVYGMPGSLPGATGVMPTGLPGRGGFWAQGGAFQGISQEAFYRSGYGGSAAAGSQIRAGLSAGGFGGYATAGMGAIQAGQELWAATSEGGAGKRALSGALSGAAAGTMIMPGIGTAIGAGVGALVGAVRGWLAPTEYEKREKDRATSLAGIKSEIESRPGGYGAIERQFGVVGMAGFNENVRNMWDPKVITAQLTELEERTNRLNTAMEKYGISWEELGEKARQSQIDTMAQGLIEDFDILTLAGADVTFVIEKMGGSINEFAQAAKRTSTEVPAGMQPMLQKMIDMGLLTDESGKAFGSLEDTGLTFAKTMTQGFDAIVDAINRVAKGLGVDIPDAIGKIPKQVDIDVAYHDTGPSPFNRDPQTSGGDYEQPPMAHWGGYITPSGRPDYQTMHWGGDVLIRAQPGEFMMSRAAVHRIGRNNLSAMNRGSGGGSRDVTLVMDGRVLARVFLPHIADEVKRQGLA